METVPGGMAVQAYVAGFLTMVLVGLGALLHPRTRPAISGPGVAVLPLSWRGIAITVWALFMVLWLTQTVALELAPPAEKGVIGPMQSLFMAWGTQLGFGLVAVGVLFLAMRSETYSINGDDSPDLWHELARGMFRQTSPRDEQPRTALPLWQTLWRTLLAFALGLPLLYTIGYFWGGWLLQLQEAGYPIEAEPQDVIGLFAQMENAGQLLALMILAVVMAPLAEELLFRGVVYRFLKSRASSVIAVGASGILFAALHFNLLSFPTLVGVGILLALLFEWTGSLRAPILFHMLFNLNTVVLIFILPESAYGP